MFDADNPRVLIAGLSQRYGLTAPARGHERFAARLIRIVNHANITTVEGLEPPKRRKARNQFYWDQQGAFVPKPPGTIRFIWSPVTGEMRLGTENNHAEQMGKGEGFDSWVRGFFFPEQKLVAIRPFFWPQGAHDVWDAEHADLNNRVMTTISNIMKNLIPSARIKADVDNNWLRSSVNFKSQRF